MHFLGGESRVKCAKITRQLDSWIYGLMDSLRELEFTWLDLVGPAVRGDKYFIFEIL